MIFFRGDEMDFHKIKMYLDILGICFAVGLIYIVIIGVVTKQLSPAYLSLDICLLAFSAWEMWTRNDVFWMLVDKAKDKISNKRK